MLRFMLRFYDSLILFWGIFVDIGLECYADIVLELGKPEINYTIYINIGK